MTSPLQIGTSLPASARWRRKRVVRRGKSISCKACAGPFLARSRAHIYCSRKICRRKRRLEYMRAYMLQWKKDHPDYWKTEKQRKYLKRWREEHPDYFREYAARLRKKDGSSRTRGRGRRPAPSK